MEVRGQRLVEAVLVGAWTGETTTSLSYTAVGTATDSPEMPSWGLHRKNKAITDAWHHRWRNLRCLAAEVETMLGRGESALSHTTSACFI
jgi:hypothetical protein